jgi:hypothetical protein
MPLLGGKIQSHKAEITPDFGVGASNKPAHSEAHPNDGKDPGRAFEREKTLSEEDFLFKCGWRR